MSKTRTPTATKKMCRCAIYTRKSTPGHCRCRRLGAGARALTIERPRLRSRSPRPLRGPVKGPAALCCLRLFHDPRPCDEEPQQTLLLLHVFQCPTDRLAYLFT